MKPFKAVVLADACREGDLPSPIRGEALELVSVANKPILFYGLEALRDADVTEVVLVVHPQLGEEIRETVGDGSSWGLRVTYVTVKRRLGLMHALRAAEPVLSDAPFVVYPGNGVLMGSLRPLLKRFTRARLQALLPLRRVADPTRHTVAAMHGALPLELVPEPLNGNSDLALDGVYVFGPAIHPAAREVVPSWRGQLELADAISRLLRDNERVEARPLEAWWSYHGHPHQLLDANRLLLDRLKSVPEGTNVCNSSIEGRVAISTSARVESTTIRGPVIIGPGAQVADAYIGPYTSVGPTALVQGAEVENSIIMAGAEVKDLGARLEASVIGEAATVYRNFSLPKVLQLEVARGLTAALG